MKWIKYSEFSPLQKTPVLIKAKSLSGNEWIKCVAEWHFLSEEYPVSWSCVGVSGYDCENDFDEDEIDSWMHIPE